MVNMIFLDIGVMIIVATIVAYLANKFKQPRIPAYIIAGLLIGPGVNIFLNSDWLSKIISMPVGFSLITNTEIITTLSEIGIAFLLFIVGLEINLKKLKDIEVVAGVGGAIQVTVLFLLGFVLINLFVGIPLGYTSASICSSLRFF